MDKPTKRGGKRPGSGRKPGTPNLVTKDIKLYAATFGKEAVDKLAGVMRNPDTPAVAVVASARELLDRGFGKSAVSINVAEIQISKIPWEELREITKQSIEEAERKHMEVIDGRYERLGITKEYDSE